MGNLTVEITRSGTAIVVKVGKKTESFDSAYLTRYEIIDRARWICITHGGNFPEETIQDILEGR